MVDIIAVIDGIAFQTNILALNAALVEEAAAATESLKEQTTNLASVISVFKLDAVQSASILSIREHVIRVEQDDLA